jgi:transposase
VDEARLDAVHALRRAHQQLSGFLLRQGCHYRRPAWTKLHRRWLAGLKFEQAVHHIALEDYVQTVEAAEARRDRLTAQIEAMLPDWTLAPVAFTCASWISLVVQTSSGEPPSEPAD